MIKSKVTYHLLLIAYKYIAVLRPKSFKVGYVPVFKVNDCYLHSTRQYDGEVLIYTK